jgi:regulatory protein
MNSSKRKLSKSEALLQLQNLCSRTEKSEFEVRKKLDQWGLQNEANTIIEHLKKDDFLNPLRFARSFAHDKIAFNRWGKIKVRYQLRGHQIADDIIEAVFTEYDDKGYFDMVTSELRKKKESIRESNTYKLKAKLFAFGNQRGYESSIINDFLDKAE